MTYLINEVQRLLGEELSSIDFFDLQERLLRTIVVVFVFWLLRFLIIQFVHYETENVRTRYWWQKITNYLVGIISLILICRIWLGGFETVATVLGLASAGLVIALQGPVTDLAGWIFLMWRRPFQVGDRVQLGNNAGDVIDIRLFQFAMLEIGNWVEADQSTGRIIHIPNRKVFSEVLANYSEGFEYIWNEIPVLITFESDWEQAKAMLQEIADRNTGDEGVHAASQLKQAARRYMIMYSKLTPIVYTRLDTYGIVLTIRYLSQIRRRRSTAQAIWEDILRAFTRHPDINFAYPTQRLYSNWLEGQQTIGHPRKLEGITLADLTGQVDDHTESNSKPR